MQFRVTPCPRDPLDCSEFATTYQVANRMPRWHNLPWSCDKYFFGTFEGFVICPYYRQVFPHIIFRQLPKKWYLHCFLVMFKGFNCLKQFLQGSEWFLVDNWHHFWLPAINESLPREKRISINAASRGKLVHRYTSSTPMERRNLLMAAVLKGVRAGY